MLILLAFAFLIKDPTLSHRAVAVGHLLTLLAKLIQIALRLLVVEILRIGRLQQA